jgi:hypothetical protein
VPVADTGATVAKKVTVPEALGLELEPMTTVVAFLGPVRATICDNVALDAEKPELPEYAALSLTVPVVRPVTEYVATPFTSACGAELLPPTVKVTVPVGMPVAGATGATVAVKVTDPDTFGLELEVITVVVKLGEG